MMDPSRYTLFEFILNLVSVNLVLLCLCSDFAGAQHNEWIFESIRTEIDPVHKVSQEVKHQGSPTLMLSGNGKAYANGSWTKSYQVEADEFYKFTAFFKTQDIDEVDRSILASITWLNQDKEPQGFLEFPGVQATNDRNGWQKIEQVYNVPQGVVTAKINLIYRWDPNGSVNFGGISLVNTEAPRSRLVKVGTIHHRPMNTSTPQENLEQFKQYIHQAGSEGVDIVCLPEGITVVGNGKSYLEVSEQIPGPTTDFLGALAKEYHMYIVAGMMEKEGPVLYNTAVLIDREGEVAGRYRKVSLPKEEILGGITPGSDFPVFETDFGRLGMMICWDVFFPEPARTLSLKGAEIIFMPIWGGDLTLSKARAIENQVFLVSSTYDMKTAVFDKRGNIVTEGTDKNPLAVVEIDLNQRELWPWLGEFKNRIRREMPTRIATNYE